MHDNITQILHQSINDSTTEIKKKSPGQALRSSVAFTFVFMIFNPWKIITNGGDGGVRTLVQTRN